MGTPGLCYNATVSSSDVLKSGNLYMSLEMRGHQYFSRNLGSWGIYQRVRDSHTERDWPQT